MFVHFKLNLVNHDDAIRKSSHSFNFAGKSLVVSALLLLIPILHPLDLLQALISRELNLAGCCFSFA